MAIGTGLLWKGLGESFLGTGQQILRGGALGDFAGEPGIDLVQLLRALGDEGVEVRQLPVGNLGQLPLFESACAICRTSMLSNGFLSTRTWSVFPTALAISSHE